MQNIYDSGLYKLLNLTRLHDWFQSRDPILQCKPLWQFNMQSGVQMESCSGKTIKNFCDSVSRIHNVVQFFSVNQIHCVCMEIDRVQVENK